MRILGPAALALAFSMSIAWSQLVIGTQAGLVSYVENDVYLNDQKLAPAQATFPNIANHAVLRTENGRAEILLNPCVVLHLGDNSSLRMIENQTADARLALLSGSAIVHVDGRIKDSKVTLAVRDRAIPLLKDGVYRFDMADLPRVRVFSGSVTVQTAGRHIDVKAGSELTFADHIQRPVSFDRHKTDALDLWSRQRETALAKSSDLFRRESQNEREVREASTRAASVEIDNSDPTVSYHRPRQSPPPLFS